MTTLLKEVGQTDFDPGRLAGRVIRTPVLLGELIEGLGAKAAHTKYGCARILRQIGERRPELLYSRFDFFAGLLKHQNKIFQWEAVFVLSHLAGVDAGHRFDALFKQYFAPIRGPVMITAANVISGAARIALARPDWADRIAAEVLGVGCARYQTAECRNVAIGHAIVALGQFTHLLRDAKPVFRFVRQQLRNTRPATRKKAERFLHRHQGYFGVSP
jgi:hypothetical protein